MKRSTIRWLYIIVIIILIVGIDLIIITYHVPAELDNIKTYDKDKLDNSLSLTTTTCNTSSICIKNQIVENPLNLVLSEFTVLVKDKYNGKFDENTFGALKLCVNTYFLTKLTIETFNKQNLEIIDNNNNNICRGSAYIWDEIIVEASATNLDDPTCLFFKYTLKDMAEKSRNQYRHIYDIYERENTYPFIYYLINIIGIVALIRVWTLFADDMNDDEYERIKDGSHA